MKRHQIHLAIAAASMLAAACGSTSDSRRTGAYSGPGPAGSGVATVPQQGGAPVVGAGQVGGGTAGTAGGARSTTPPTIVVPATGSGAGSSRANSNDPTGAYSGPGATGTGTASPNVGRSSEQIVGERQARAMDRHQMSELIGADVRNRQGEKIGDIEEVIIDAQGNPALAIVSTGGFLGLGESMHAVPYQALERAPTGTDRLLDISKEQLRQAPSFKASERPYLAPDWRNQNQRAYGNR